MIMKIVLYVVLVWAFIGLISIYVEYYKVRRCRETTSAEEYLALYKRYLRVSTIMFLICILSLLRGIS